jgi:ribosomal protein S18 acetylase RimI-like enzyme
MTEILRELSPAALAAAIEANEVAYWRYHVHVAGWELIEEPGITSYMSSRPEVMRNGVFFTDLAPGVADDAIAATIERFRARSLPFVWWGGPSRRPHDLGRRLLAHGLVLDAVDPGLAADLTALREDLPAPAGLSIERVRDDEGLRLWLRTLDNKTAEQMAAQQSADYRYVAERFDGDDSCRLFLARLHGEPVATCELLLGAGVAGIYCVGTLPTARRRGIGSAIVLAALREARAAGYRAAVLGSSPMGLGVYQRLGFVEYCKLTMHSMRL